MSRALEPPDGDTVRLQLFIAGSSPRSGSAVSNLRRLGDEEFRGDYELEIIDVTEHPDRAESARILTTPTVIKTHPLPQRRVTGDLSRRAEVLAALGPHLRASPPTPGDAH